MDRLIDKLPGILVGHRYVLNAASLMSLSDRGYACRHAAELVARGIAEAILKQRDLITITEDQETFTVNVVGRCVVIGEDELRASLLAMYRKGINNSYYKEPPSRMYEPESKEEKP